MLESMEKIGDAKFDFRKLNPHNRPEQPRKIDFTLDPKVLAWKYALYPTYLFLLSLPPKFVRGEGFRPKKKLGPTSYLDALRGYAALIVVNHHGFPGPGPPFTYPFFNVLLAGRAMVDVFFVISGYVLSMKFLKLMRARDTTRLLDHFTSSVFRRYLRLYLSAIFVTFVSMLLVWRGWNIGWIRVDRYDTLNNQFWDWLFQTIRFMNPFAHLLGYWPEDESVHTHKYDEVLWTIPLEFGGSVLIYAFCLATCRLATKYRMVLCWGIIYLCYLWSAIWAALFLMGLFLADLNLSRQHASTGQILPSSKEGFPTKPQPIKERVAFSLVLVVSLFILGQPNKNRDMAPWPWPQFEAMVPNYLKDGEKNLLEEHFWLSIGSAMLVWALDSYPTLQIPLKWNFSQYLGEISFGVYVVHMLVRFTLWDGALMPWRIPLFGDGSLSYLPFVLIYYPATFWAGELFARVDSHFVRFGRWIEGRAFVW